MFELYLFFTFVLGTVIGGLLNIIIYNLPKKIYREEKIIAKEILNISINSTKLKNKTKISGFSKFIKYLSRTKYTNIKLVFIKKKILTQCNLTALLTALSFCLVAYLSGFNSQSFALILLTCFFIPLFVIDIKHHILPDNLTIPLIWTGLILNSYEIFISLNDSVWGALLGYLSLWHIYWIYKFLTAKEGFGYGDFKLLAAIGAWFGYQMLIYTIFVSCIIGLIIAVLINILKHKTNVIAFGPSIILATIFYLATKNNLYLYCSRAF